MEHIALYVVNVGFCTIHILSKWIQLQSMMLGGEQVREYEPMSRNKYIWNILMTRTKYF